LPVHAESCFRGGFGADHQRGPVQVFGGKSRSEASADAQ
jgi:hypothetical protein